MTYIFGDLGRCWSIFRDLGSKGKILLGSRGNYFQGSGEINALFSCIKGAQTPLGASLEDLKVLRRSPDLFNNVKIGQGQLLLIIKYILFYHIWGCSHFVQVT